MIQINEVILAFMFLILTGIAMKVFSMESRTAASWRIEAKLDLLMKHAGIEYEPFNALSAEVQDALQRGQKIEAIKLYRQATGVGLKEAKDAVEAAERDMKLQ
jgi:ribosomal protein L7/L12